MRMTCAGTHAAVCAMCCMASAGSAGNDGCSRLPTTCSATHTRALTPPTRIRRSSPMHTLQVFDGGGVRERSIADDNGEKERRRPQRHVEVVLEEEVVDLMGGVEDEGTDH